MSYPSSHHIKIAAAIVAGFFMASPANAGGNVTKGAEIFGGTCVACHGEDGKGAFPGVPDFTQPDGRLSKSDSVLIKHITNGFESPGADMAMPELGGNEDLTEQDVKDVLAYLRATFQPKK